MEKHSFPFPTKARHLLLSTQTIRGVVRAIIRYNFGELKGHVYQRLFIDYDTIEWVAKEILAPPAFRAFCHPLLLRQALISLSDEIAQCHRELKITASDKRLRVSKFSQSQILLSIQKLYKQSLRNNKARSTCRNLN